MDRIQQAARVKQVMVLVLGRVFMNADPRPSGPDSWKKGGRVDVILLRLSVPIRGTEV